MTSLPMTVSVSLPDSLRLKFRRGRSSDGMSMSGSSGCSSSKKEEKNRFTNMFWTIVKLINQRKLLYMFRIIERVMFNLFLTFIRETSLPFKNSLSLPDSLRSTMNLVLVRRTCGKSMSGSSRCRGSEHE